MLAILCGGSNANQLSLMLRIFGPSACFTRQELKVDRVSYDIITPPAARAIFECILRKPEFSWAIHRIEVLKPVRTETLTVNEVNASAQMRSLMAAMSGTGELQGIDIGKARTQRTSTILRDVDYLVHARLTLADALPDEQMTKYIQMFYRRAGRGECFNHPYLGCKEHAANVALVRDHDRALLPPAIQETRDLGMMLYSVFTPEGVVSPAYFHARMRDGVVDVPAPASAGILR